ncbi:hypothetical protein F5Y18DRAFT_118047 [Xylariaceae sp. FL1019]|nr:hypothetical protein F5Y18DRAFT_118047 [Xylariaceae sp. FL1019]
MTIKMKSGPSKFVCDCNKSFATQSDLSNHRRDSLSHRKPSAGGSITTGVNSPAQPAKGDLQTRKIVCDCDQKFATVEDLAKHRRDSSLHRRAFICDCKKSFSAIESLVRHQKEHPKTIVCDCGKKLGTKAALAQHLQTADIHRQKFTCICDKAFVTFADLAQHVGDSPHHNLARVKDTKEKPSKTHHGSRLTTEVSLLNVLYDACRKQLREDSKA